MNLVVKQDFTAMIHIVISTKVSVDPLQIISKNHARLNLSSHIFSSVSVSPDSLSNHVPQSFIYFHFVFIPTCRKHSTVHRILASSLFVHWSDLPFV